MCLTTVNVIRDGIPKSPRKEYIGYKVFDKYNRKLHFEFMNHFKLVFNEWLTAKNTPVKVSDSVFYPAGFHVFQTEEAAKNYAGLDQKVIRVRCKGLLASGTQYGSPVNVFTKMFVPKPRKKKRKS